MNNITQMIDVAGTHNFTYDRRDRLTAATHPNQTNEGYTLEDVGHPHFRYHQHFWRYFTSASEDRLL